METKHRHLGALLNEKRMTLAEAIVAKQYALQPGVWERYGEEGRKLSVRDQGYHLQFLAEAILVSDASLFTEYVQWARELFASIKLPESGLTAALECTRDVLREHLPPELAAITDEYIGASLNAVQQPLTRTPEYLSASAPLAGLARQYIDALLQGDRRRASQLVLEAVEQGAAVKDIYLQVFQRAQYEIGRLWMTNTISVAQEHFCTAATQLIMSQLYPSIFSTERVGRCLVAACVGGELHEIGVRMVADFFEMEGWDTYYLGANTPTMTIIQALKDRRPHVLGISATMTFHLRLVQDLIAHVRRAELEQPIKIMVGGYPFKKHPDLWKQVGADGFSPDAQGAIDVANSLVAG
jgi:methylmalonyl-CoA mutase cobalamin-binding domain/chain